MDVFAKNINALIQAGARRSVPGDEKDLRPRVKKGAEGQKGDEAEAVDERAVEMSDDDHSTDATRRREMKPDFRSFFM